MAEGSNGIPVVVMGLGAIGQAIARAALEKPEVELVAALDPAFAGKRLDEVLGVPAPALTVGGDEAKAFGEARGGVVLHATGSSFEGVLPQLERAVKAGLSVVSTCEELAYPWLRFEAAAERLHELCESRGVTVVGTGVNPGFALDRLPAFLAQVTGPVRHLRATRVVDLAGRRASLWRKAGVGLDEEPFHEALERGTLGHVGLIESAALAAYGCGFELDEVEEDAEPVLADEDVAGPAAVRKGQAVGVHQVVRGFVEEVERVRLELTLALGAEGPRDEVEIDARPPVKVTVHGGLPGDEATAWAVVNAAPTAPMLHGLITVMELPAGR